MIKLPPRTGALLANPQAMLRLCLALALLAGCIDDGSGDDAPESSGPIWGLNVSSAKIQIGASTYVGAVDVAPRAGEPGMPVRATFTSDNKMVVTVDSSYPGSARITGVGVGTAHVLAHYAGEEQSVTIEVLPRPQPESL